MFKLRRGGGLYMGEVLEKLDKYLLFFIIYTFCFIVLFGTIGYTLPFILAFSFALLLRKPTRYLIERLKINRTAACLITNLVFFSIIFGLVAWVIVTFTTETISLAKNSQEYITNHYDEISSFVERVYIWVSELIPDINLTFKDNLIGFITKYLGSFMNISGKVLSGTLGFLSNIPYCIMVVFFTVMSTYFFSKDMSKGLSRFKIVAKLKNDTTLNIINKVKEMVGGYLFSYFTIIMITFLETLIVFMVLDVRYALILSVMCAFFDMLPIVGIAIIYVPVAIVYWIMGSKTIAIGVIVAYALVSIIRQIIEPKLVSSSMGLHPVSVLAAIFIGLKAAGVTGMFFCLFMVVFFKTMREVNVL